MLGRRCYVCEGEKRPHKSSVPFQSVPYSREFLSMVRLLARFWNGESEDVVLIGGQIRQIDELRLLLCPVPAIRCSIHYYRYTVETFPTWMVAIVFVYLLRPYINV